MKKITVPEFLLGEMKNSGSYIEKVPKHDLYQIVINYEDQIYKKLEKWLYALSSDTSIYTYLIAEPIHEKDYSKTTDVNEELKILMKKISNATFPYPIEHIRENMSSIINTLKNPSDDYPNLLKFQKIPHFINIFQIYSNALIVVKINNDCPYP